MCQEHSMCLWKDFNQFRKVESLSNESYSTGIACRNINGGELDIDHLNILVVAIHLECHPKP